MFPQLEILDSHEIPTKDKMTYFLSLGLQGADVNEEQLKAIRENINNLVEQPDTRVDGLLYFEKALQQYEPFYLDTWPFIINANLNSTDTSCQEIACRILKLILKPSNFPGHIATVRFYIPEFAKKLIAITKADSVLSLQCLVLCIKQHSGIGACVEELESFIMEHMDTNSTQICEIISECFVHYFSGRAISTTGNANPSVETYSFYYKKTLCTLQYILNKLLIISDDYNFFDNDTENLEPFDLPEIPTIPFSRTMMLARLFSSYSVCAAKMACISLSSDHKPFDMPIEQILNFVMRIFDIVEYSKNKKPDDRERFQIVFPMIHKGTFIMLESLIKNFDLIEQVENILTIFRKSIEVSCDINSFSGFNICQIRFITWKILNLWLSKCGTRVSFETGNDKYLIEQLLSDIIPGKLADTPIKSKVGMKVPIKGKITECAFPIPDENTQFNKLRIKTTNEALRVLEGLIYTSGSFIEEKFKELIATCVLKTIYAVQKNIHPQKKILFPYMDDKCRKNLYDLCLTICLSSNFHLRVQNECFAIFRIAQRDPSLEVKKMCYFACAMYKSHLHPRKKFPEVLTNKKTVSVEEEPLLFGWHADNVANYNADRGNHHAYVSNMRPDNRSGLTQENHDNMNENIRQNNFEQPYIKHIYENNEFCNGDDLSDAQVSSQSDSESEEECQLATEIPRKENVSKSSSRPFISSVQSVVEIKKEISTHPSVDSEEDNLSIVDEDQEYCNMDEGESKLRNHSKASMRAEQNGLASVSDDEMLSSSKGENGEYDDSADEEDYDDEEEEEDAKDFYDDQRHESGDFDEEFEPPKKRLRISKENYLEEQEDVVIDRVDLQEVVVQDQEIAQDNKITQKEIVQYEDIEDEEAIQEEEDEIGNDEEMVQEEEEEEVIGNEEVQEEEEEVIGNEEEIIEEINEEMIGDEEIVQEEGEEEMPDDAKAAQDERESKEENQIQEVIPDDNIVQDKIIQDEISVHEEIITEDTVEERITIEEEDEKQECKNILLGENEQNIKENAPVSEDLKNENSNTMPEKVKVSEAMLDEGSGGKSPTLEEMCNDLVLKASADLAES